MSADLPLQVGETEVRRMAGPARLDMGRLLAGALDPIRPRVALVGLAGTAQRIRLDRPSEASDDLNRLLDEPGIVAVRRRYRK